MIKIIMIADIFEISKKLKGNIQRHNNLSDRQRRGFAIIFMRFFKFSSWYEIFNLKLYSFELIFRF